jgi:hypothetical protein
VNTTQLEARTNAEHMRTKKLVWSLDLVRSKFCLDCLRLSALIWVCNDRTRKHRVSAVRATMTGFATRIRIRIRSRSRTSVSFNIVRCSAQSRIWCQVLVSVHANVTRRMPSDCVLTVLGCSKLFTDMLRKQLPTFRLTSLAAYEDKRHSIIQDAGPKY